jgi:hypothetical protein
MPVRICSRRFSHCISGIDFAKLKSQSIGIELIQAPPHQRISSQRKGKSAPDISDLLSDEDGFYRYSALRFLDPITRRSGAQGNLESNQEKESLNQTYTERKIPAGEYEFFILF